jgi:hypothetical protein
MTGSKRIALPRAQRAGKRRGAVIPAVEIALHPPTEPELIDVPPARYLCLDGTGDPEDAQFRAAVLAISLIASTIKTALEKAGRESFECAPLEGLWWKNSGRWKLLLRIPDSVSTAVVELAKHSNRSAFVDHRVPPIAVARIAEGESVQVLHVGSYATAVDSIAKMEALMVARGLRPSGPRHEIYLSDARSKKPMTLLRQPVCTAPNSHPTW